MTLTHQQEPSSQHSPLMFHGDAEMVQQIADLIQSHTGEQWEILQLTHYEEHWVALGYQGGLQLDFLFGQTSEQLVYCVAEKTIYPHSKSIWRYSAGTHEPLELVTYVVQYGGTQCNDCTVSTDFTQDALRDYLLDYELGTDILVTRFYGEREDGVGRYRKHQDGTFTAVFEEVEIGGLLRDLNLPCQEHTEGCS